MNIVIPDCQQLPEGVDFPPLAANKFGWQQFLGLNREELKERCWRSHCVVTFNTHLDAETINSMSKLELLVIASPNVSLVDAEAAKKNNVTVCHIPDLDAAQFDINKAEDAQQLCNTVVKVIDHYMLQSA